MALAALVLGIAGVVTAAIPYVFVLGWIVGVLAIVFGAIGRSRAKDPAIGGKTRATLGLGLGVAAVLLGGLGLGLTVNAVNSADKTASTANPSSTYSPPTTYSNPTPTPSTAESCTSKGIGISDGAEGDCIGLDGQSRYTVVNRGHELNLEELGATVVGVRTAKTITSDMGTVRASGTYVIVTLNVANRLDSATQFDQSRGQAALVAGGSDPNGKNQTFTENFNAENGYDQQSFEWGGPDTSDPKIQPGMAKTGDLVFDVPDQVASNLSQTALGVVNFSQADSYRSSGSSTSTPAHYGLIRLGGGPTA